VETRSAAGYPNALEITALSFIHSLNYRNSATHASITRMKVCIMHK